MDELLRYFEEELGLFGQYAREFRNRFPKPASDLHISGETYEDPSVARLIQSVAFMSARIRKRLDDDYPKFTESLLESLYPHYLRPLPSHTIVQIGNRGASELLPEVRLLPRGTLVRSSGEGAICFFRTVYDLTLAPIVLSRAEFSPFIDAPRAAGLPRGVTSSISIVIERGGDKVDLGDGVLDRLRLFVDGEPSLRAALIDALFMKSKAAFLQVNRDATWLPLDKVPLRLAGFGDEDEMVPFPSRAHPAFRLLTEYFTYPEKFNFIDIDLSEIMPLLPAQCTRFTLHLALADVPSDSGEARLLSALSHKNLLLGCTPIINLFDKAGEPLQLAHTSAEYILCADSAHASSYEIHSVNQVRLVHGSTGPTATTEFGPLYSVDFERQALGAKRNYWITRRDETTAAVSPGHEMRIALIDGDFKPSQAAGATLSVELTCTNRDLPCQMRYGLPEGDMHTDGIPSSSPVRVLRRPSPTYRFDARQGSHWRLIAHLALNHARLTDAGLLDFQKMLALYDLPRSAISQRLIKGIVGLAHGTVRAWIKTEPMSTLMPGIGIRMTVDEQAFVGSGIYVFAQVMERYFAMNSQLNCFTQLQIVSQQTGEEILTCPPRTAEQTRA